MRVVCIDDDWTNDDGSIGGPTKGLIYEVTESTMMDDGEYIRVDGSHMWYERAAFRPATDADCPLQIIRAEV